MTVASSVLGGKTGADATASGFAGGGEASAVVRLLTERLFVGCDRGAIGTVFAGVLFSLPAAARPFGVLADAGFLAVFAAFFFTDGEWDFVVFLVNL
jgi:hypothetical protein